MPLPPKKEVATPEQGEKLQSLIGELTQNKPLPTENLAFLIYGQSGVGKTFSLRTAKKPLFVDSFDPGGSVVLSDLVEQKKAIVISEYEDEDPNKPTAFEKWDKNMDRFIKSGIFSHIGTYVMDSATTWGQAALNLVLKKASRTGGVPQQNDWYPQMVLMEAGIRRILSLPCDVVFICHEDVQKDELLGKLWRSPMLTGKSKTRIPLLFSELYYCTTTRDSKGVRYEWQLSRDNLNQARSRMCGLMGLKLDHVPQDFSALMKTFKRPYEDLPDLSSI